jgi:hypothetical protein
LRERGIDVNRDTLQKIGLELGNEIGYDGLTQLLMTNVDSNQNYAIDGVRHLSTLEYLREQYQERFALLYRDVEITVRWKMHNQRSPEGNQVTLDEFQVIDKAPVESEIDQLKSEADLILSYAKDPTVLFGKLDAFLLDRFGLIRKEA